VKRDNLLRQILALPVGTDIGVEIGADRLDVTGIVPWGGGRFAALRCRPSDLRDLLVDWGIPAALRDEFAPARPEGLSMAGALSTARMRGPF
jgi:hypothetical protein